MTTGFDAASTDLLPHSLFKPSAHPTAIRGMLVGGTRGHTRLIANIVQQLVIHAGTLAAFWLAWRDGVTWVDMSAFLLFYLLTGAGVSIGFHRLFSHQSFTAPAWLRFVLAVLGCMCMQGSAARWSTDHVRHHQYSDQAGDPHSPNVDPFGRHLGFWRGLYHGHWGWMFNTVTTDRAVFGRLTWGDPVLRFTSNLHFVWAILGLVLAYGYGYWLGGSHDAGVTALLWGGCARAVLMMHGTLSATSISHRVGRKQFETGDQSRNNWLVVLLTFGDGWHNNHQKFPRSARHGMLKGEMDFSGRTIELMEKIGLISGVVRVPQSLLDRGLKEVREKAVFAE
jgi:stearoyl-CoA desaturase (Delta-9 desaturase)